MKTTLRLSTLGALLMVAMTLGAWANAQTTVKGHRGSNTTTTTVEKDNATEVSSKATPQATSRATTASKNNTNTGKATTTNNNNHHRNDNTATTGSNSSSTRSTTGGGRNTTINASNSGTKSTGNNSSGEVSHWPSSDKNNTSSGFNGNGKNNGNSGDNKHHKPTGNTNTNNGPGSGGYFSGTGNHHNSGNGKSAATDNYGGRRPGSDNSNRNYDYKTHPNYNTYNYNYHHNDWSRSVKPPTRNYRPVYTTVVRPTLSSHHNIAKGIPVISSIMGLSLGSYYDNSLSYLFSMGYEIDGYYDNVVYLRDVPMVGFTWNDVMLGYDSYRRLTDAQFIHSTAYNDRGRFNRVYHSLYNTYGVPVSSHIGSDYCEVVWFGGDSRGYVRLTYTYSQARYYTVMTVGY